MSTTTIFQKIIAREIPATIVFENEDYIAFKDIQPRAPVHVLVVPKKLSARLDEIQEPNEMGMLFMTATKVAKESLGLKDYRLAINVGPSAGQIVFHTHVHIFGGWANKSDDTHHEEMASRE